MGRWLSVTTLLRQSSGPRWQLLPACPRQGDRHAHSPLAALRTTSFASRAGDVSAGYVVLHDPDRITEPTSVAEPVSVQQCITCAVPPAWPKPCRPESRRVQE